jgi:hypothetical protein
MYHKECSRSRDALHIPLYGAAKTRPSSMEYRQACSSSSLTASAQLEAALAGYRRLARAIHGQLQHIASMWKSRDFHNGAAHLDMYVPFELIDGATVLRKLAPSDRHLVAAGLTNP